MSQRLLQLIGAGFHSCLQSSISVVRSQRNCRKSREQGNVGRARRRNSSAVAQVDGTREATLHEKWRNDDRFGNSRALEEWFSFEQLVVNGFTRIGGVDSSFGDSYVQQQRGRAISRFCYRDLADLDVIVGSVSLEL